jgi:hypothetical protein
MSKFPDYPKYKYHAHEKPVIVPHAEAERALGDEWKDSPADHHKEIPCTKEEFEIIGEEIQKKKPGRKPKAV